MFDIGFSEMVVIAVVALIVIGPERLPKVARTLGYLWGRAQRYVNGIKADISRDLALEELRQMKQKVQQEAEAAEKGLNLVSRELDQQVQQVQQLNTSIAESARKDAVPSAVNTAQPKPAIPEQQKFPID